MRERERKGAQGGLGARGAQGRVGPGRLGWVGLGWARLGRATSQIENPRRARTTKRN
jgi:hypothetical protein